MACHHSQEQIEVRYVETPLILDDLSQLCIWLVLVSFHDCLKLFKCLRNVDMEVFMQVKSLEDLVL